MQKTIMTPILVVQYSGVKLNNHSPCDFRELYSIEYRESRKCFGVRFWQDLLDMKADYSDKEPYESKAYTTGDIVSYDGLYYVALKDTSALPSVYTDWATAPFFTGDCSDKYDEFFCSFLAPYLAHTVLSIRLPYIWTHITSSGVQAANVGVGGTNYQSVEGDRYDRLQSAITRDKQIAFDNLIAYLDDDEIKEDVCFAKFQDRDLKTNACSCNGKGCKECRNIRPTRSGIYQFG